MPDYEEILVQSEHNIVALKEQIESFQSLHKDLKKRVEQTDGIPAQYDKFFDKTRKLSEDYVNGLGKTVNEYVSGNNKLFKDRISELSKLNKSFKDEIDGLSEIDLEAHFAKHNETLNKIFSSINNVNSTLIEMQESQMKIRAEIQEKTERIDEHISANSNLLISGFEENSHLVNSAFAKQAEILKANNAEQESKLLYLRKITIASVILSSASVIGLIIILLRQ